MIPRRPDRIILPVIAAMLMAVLPTRTAFMQGFRQAPARLNIATGSRHLVRKRANLVRPFALYSSAVEGNNPTAEWKGSSLSTSPFVTHVLIDRNQTVLHAVETVLREKEKERENEGQTIVMYKEVDKVKIDPSLLARDLLDLGSIWFLPASAPKEPSLGAKPMRLLAYQYNETLKKGDYLRVHHTPRRFPAVYQYDWNRRLDDKFAEPPGVIVAENIFKGWLVIDKPPRVPVHMTVDNCRENVQACLLTARQIPANLNRTLYVSTPQRLDQNTSGLLVVATSPSFAAYYAELLRNKTSQQLRQPSNTNATTMKMDDRALGGVHKVYKCLVCLQPPATSLPTTANDTETESWSVAKAWGTLQTWATEGTLLRHFLEPSIRAPKTFLPEPPADASEPWLECLLKVRQVGPVYSLLGNEASRILALRLWNDEEGDSVNLSFDPASTPPRMPRRCQAVTEIQVELLTGMYSGPECLDFREP